MAARTSGLAQYFRFLRAGAVRLGATSNRTDRLPVAFRNPNGAHVVVVQARSAGTITVVGLPAGSYGLRYTTATETGSELPPVHIGAGRSLAAHLPAPGVITVYQKKSR
jgi:Glycosyl hydrolase family 30 beta sandwich domain